MKNDLILFKELLECYKTRLNKEGNESLTKCKRLKLEAADGKSNH
jgi:hypothetical protein